MAAKAKKEKEPTAKKIDVFVDLVEKAPVYEGPLCECGEPVAPGQTYVCRKHVRSN